MPHRRIAAALPLLLLAGAAAGQGLPEITRTFGNGATVRLYGQINKGVLQYDDGIDTETYGLIDNDNSGTRFGLTYTQPFGGWTFQNVNEFSYAPYSTADINILKQTPDASDWDFDNDNIRKIDFTLAHDRYGKFWVGQGSMATDGIASIDLSGTDVIAYSGVADTAAAQIIRFSDPGLSFEESLSGIQITDAYTNFDGDRRVRLRYDTPAFNGFTVAAAYGRNLLSDDPDIRDEDLFDASLNYAGELDAVELAAGLGYYWQEDSASIFGGSASAIHAPTGLNLTVSAGTEDDNDGRYWYAKLGLLRDFVAWGATASSIDYFSGDDIFIDEAGGITSSTSESWGVAVVQKIDRANTQLWLTYRSYDYADNSASYEDGKAVFGGVFFQF
jgi:hypothetical protein